VSSTPHDLLSRVVGLFLHSKLSAILIVFSLLVGTAALLVTPREEDPQIVVPLADVFVSFPGHSAREVEQLVSTPLERMLYQIDGVEYVYSMSRDDQAIITVRFYVGQDRERSLVKLFKKINENLDAVPPGVAGWVVKPVEIDDVPIVTLTLTGTDSYTLRRVGEELVQRLAVVPEISRAYVVGGEPRVVRVEMDPDRLQGYNLSPLEVRRALAGADVTLAAGDFTRKDAVVHVDAGVALARPQQVGELVVGVFGDSPVFLKDVARVQDGPAEVVSYVRHGWGPARGFGAHPGSPGTLVGEEDAAGPASAVPAVTIALAKKKGTNAVRAADAILRTADELRRDTLPDDVQLIVTRNSGQTADEKVNDLVEALGVAIAIVIALLTLSLGWRAALIVAVAVPVVFGLTLAVNLLFGYTINRVTLFALILSLGLLVDDPIVDVENISRHFEERQAASPEIVLGAVAEIRPPLISATLAVIVSFLPMFFITGMMGPYMAPMALNVPVAMVMSMLVAFTITPWLSYVVLGRRYRQSASRVASAPGELRALTRPGSPSKDILAHHRRRRFQPVLRQDRRGDIHQRRMRCPNLPIAEQHARHFQSIGTVIGAPGRIVVQQKLIGNLALAGVPGGTIAAGIADDQIRGQGGRVAMIHLIGAIDAANDALAVNVRDRFQLGRQLVQQSVFLPRFNDAVALASFQVQVQAVDSQSIGAGLRPIHVLPQRCAIHRTEIIVLPQPCV
jgi:multidrug efflux pump subunit AcrB